MENVREINKRTPNFTNDEEQLLVSLVEKYKSTIECKKSNSTTWKDKENAWKNIEKEFNSGSGKNSYRAMKHLKEKYNNLKKKVKQKFSENKVNIIKTGGGSYTPTSYTDIDMTIKDILGAQISGFNTPYDSDFQCSSATNIEESIIIEHDYDGILEEVDTSSNIMLYDNVDPPPERYEELTVNLDILNSEKENTETIDPNWTNYTSKTLKRPVSSKLAVKVDKRRKTNYSQGSKKYLNINGQLIEEKLEFVRYQKEKFEEEHNLKMKILRRKLEIKELENLNK